VRQYGAVTEEPIAVLAIRVWAEGDPPTVFRSRVTQTNSLFGGQETVTFTGERAEVERLVREWLDTFEELLVS
jgi:hypothetical protein